jgi:hypothetical protein
VDTPSTGNPEPAPGPAPEPRPESPPKRRSGLRRAARFGLGAILVLALLGSIGWLVLGWPQPMQLWIALVVVAGCSFFGLIALFITKDLDPRLQRALAGATGLILLIAAVMAVQGTSGSATGNGGKAAPETSAPEASATPAPAEPEPSGEADPMTATPFLDCQDFAVPKSVLSHLPKPTDGGLDANWIYEHGGAAVGALAFTFQGKSEAAVLIRQVRVVDLVRNPAPSDVVHILPCGPQGGGARPRYFEVNLGDPPNITARPSELDEDGEQKPPVEFPIKVTVSNSDLELYVLRVAGPECFCEWRLAIDWTSAGQSGTTIVGYGSPKIRSDKTDLRDRPQYAFVDGKWQKWE